MSTQEFPESSALAPASTTEQPARSTDFVSHHALMLTERIDAEARMTEALAAALAAEERTAGRINAAMERMEALTETLSRAQASVDLATGNLQSQAQMIAKLFQEQLTKPDVDGVPTLRTHVMRLGDMAAKSAAKALDDAANEAAALAGVKAETAALQKVTAVIVEAAKTSGLDGAVRAVVGSATRLDQTLERIESASLAMTAARESRDSDESNESGGSQAPKREYRAPQGPGAGNLAWLWLSHHLGTPGMVIGVIALSYGAFKIFS